MRTAVSAPTVKLSALDKVLVTKEEAAEMLCVSIRLLWLLTKFCDLPCVRIGALKLYRPAALDAWAADAEKSPPDLESAKQKQQQEKLRHKKQPVTANQCDDEED